MVVGDGSLAWVSGGPEGLKMIRFMSADIKTELDEIDADRRRSICKRWGVSWQTVTNWRAKGVEVGTPPPLESPVGRDLLVWYRGAYGREPVTKLKELVAREEEAGHEPAGAEVIIDVHPVRVIKAALERLGLSLTIARLIEEDERCWAEYKRAQKLEEPTDALRRRWSDITEEKRKTQNSKDAVVLATELFKEWMRGELEPREAERRKNLSGVRLGLRAKGRLLGATTDAEWVRIWDEELEAALVVEGRGTTDGHG